MPLPNHPESDPLAAFDAESATVPEESSLPADPPATPADRAAEEIAALKAQVATLVAALEDIKQRPRATPARSPARLGAAGAAAAGAAALLWAFAPPASRAPLSSALAPPSALVPPVAAASAAPTEPPRAPLLDSRQPAPAAREPSGEPRPAQPRTYVGTLTMDAEPAGEVFINREPAGRTPLRVRNLRAGSHLVWIERDGYRRWTRVVPVPADRVSRVSATLERTAP